jgi:hypothetical protein
MMGTEWLIDQVNQARLQVSYAFLSRSEINVGMRHYADSEESGSATEIVAVKCRGCSAHLEDVVADSDASKPGDVLGASTFPTLRVTKIVVVGENVVIDQTTVTSTATHLPHVVNVIIGLNVSSYPRPVAVPDLTVVNVVACFKHAGLRVVGKVFGNKPTDVDDTRVCFIEWPTRAVATDGGRAQADLELTARGVERDAGHALLVVEEPEKSRNAFAYKEWAFG